MIDFEQFHRLAVRPARVMPPRLSACQLDAMTPSAREAYGRAVRLWVNGRTFATPESEVIRAKLDECVRNAEGSVGQPSGVVIMGEPTVGKSDTVNRWLFDTYRSLLTPAELAAKEAPRRGKSERRDDAFVPIVALDLTPLTDKYSFTRQNRSYLHASPVKNSTEATTDLARRWLLHGTQILKIDDANLLRLSEATGKSTRDSIKSAMTTLGNHDGVVIVVGKTPEMFELLADLQTFGRVDLVKMWPYALDEVEDKLAWFDLLVALFSDVHQLLPGLVPRELANEVAPRLWRRTQGYLGDVVKSVKVASIAAASEGADTLTASRLLEVRLSGRATRHEERLEHNLQRRADLAKASA